VSWSVIIAFWAGIGVGSIGTFLLFWKSREGQD